MAIACDEPLQRVHIVNSANFPTVGSSTIAYSIMANADRIARASADRWTAPRGEAGLRAFLAARPAATRAAG